MTRTVESAIELTNLVELRDIRFWEVSAKRVAVDDSKNQQDLEAFVRVEGDELGIRCRSTVRGEGGSYVADVEAIFSVPDADLEFSEDAVQEFVERVGLMVVYPYIRATISDSAGRLTLKRPLMRLMKPGTRLERASGNDAPATQVE